MILKKPHCCFTLQKRKKKEGARGHQARTGTGRAPRWEEQHARRPGVRGARAVGHPAASHLEALVGSTVLPQLKCSPFVLSQWARLPAGFGRQRGGSTPAGLATGHHPAAQALAGRDSLPGRPHSLQLAAPALIRPSFLPLPPAPSLPPAVSLVESVPCGTAAPTSSELSTDWSPQVPLRG